MARKNPGSIPVTISARQQLCTTHEMKSYLLVGNVTARQMFAGHQVCVWGRGLGEASISGDSTGMLSCYFERPSLVSLGESRK